MSGDGPTGADLVERLAAIGVEQREAQLFVHLCLTGPSRASDAAAATRLKRTETYRALESLMKRGFVTAHLTRPVVYEAVAPEALFAELLADHEQRREEISRLREKVVAAVIDSKGQREGSQGRHGYKIVQGRRAILSALEASVRGARSNLSIVSTWLGGANASAQNRTFQTTLKRASEGLPMRILLRETSGTDRTVETLLAHPSARVRVLDVPHSIRFCVIDGREIVYWLVSDPETGMDARGDVAMWTNAVDFVRAQQAHFDALWTGAREPIRVPARN